MVHFEGTSYRSHTVCAPNATWRLASANPHQHRRHKPTARAVLCGSALVRRAEHPAIRSALAANHWSIELHYRRSEVPGQAVQGEEAQAATPEERQPARRQLASTRPTICIRRRCHRRRHRRSCHCRRPAPSPKSTSCRTILRVQRARCDRGCERFRLP